MTSFKTRSAGYLANHVARLFARELAEAVRPLGLAPAQFMTLLELWRQDGLTQKDLVARLDVEQATMAATLARMERDGLIERRPDQSDARARRIQLTARARSLEEPALAAARSVNARALAGFSEAERDAFLAGLRRVVGALSRTAELDQPSDL
jgi:DNA-binding MarR family transcriptional regulator